MFLVANIEDIKFALNGYAQAVSNPTGKLWLMKVPLLHLLENDFQRDASFLRLKPRFLRLKPPLPAWKIACKCRNGKLFITDNPALPHQSFDVPLWVKIVLRKKQPIYLFDLAAASAEPLPAVWQQIGRIRDWFNSNSAPADSDYASLSFLDAAERADMRHTTGEPIHRKNDYLKKVELKDIQSP